MEWHCSEHNVPRYDGSVTLPPALEGEGTVRALRSWTEIGPGGLRGPSEASDYAAIAIDGDAPAVAVGEALERLAESLPVDAVRALLLARPDTFDPRPPPPLAAEVLPRIRSAAIPGRARHAPVHLRARIYLASGRCRWAADAALSRCDEGARQIAAALTDPACDADAPELLAMFAVRWGKGEGQPFLSVPIHARVGDLPPQQGTWAQAVHEWLRKPQLAMAPMPVRVFHQRELELKRRARLSYPEAARKLGEQRCLARVSIDETGVPYDVAVEGCIRLLHAAVRGALLRWRWYPPKNGRDFVEAKTTVAITFRAPR